MALWQLIHLGETCTLHSVGTNVPNKSSTSCAKPHLASLKFEHFVHHVSLMTTYIMPFSQLVERSFSILVPRICKRTLKPICLSYFKILTKHVLILDKQSIIKVASLVDLFDFSCLFLVICRKHFTYLQLYEFTDCQAKR